MRSRLFMAVTCACFFGLFLSSFPSSSPADNRDASPPQSDSDPIFARINDRVMHLSEFQRIFHNAVRNKFYHGAVPDAELKAFRLKVSKDIVDQVLLKQEAEKLEIQPNIEEIKAKLAQHDQRYSMTPGWQPRSEEENQLIISRLSQRNVIEQLEARIKDVAKPSRDKVREYYQKNPDKFTEPKRLRVSVILLPVPPSSMSDAWKEAEQVGQTLIERVKNGEKFADLAKEYSAHASSVNGGDLGYLHQDMLEPDAQQAVDKLKLNEVTPPVRVLRGFTIFQLNGVREPRLNPFETVEQRAGDLLYRDMQNESWSNFMAQLREKSDVMVNDELLGSEQ